MTTCYLYLKLQAGKITVKWKLIEEVLNKVGMGGGKKCHINYLVENNSVWLPVHYLMTLS
jgi:hypothetical protein